MLGKKGKCNKNLLRQYPCDDFLRSALHFIEIGKPNDAYTEICWAIMKSGGELFDNETRIFKAIQNKEMELSDTWKQQTMSRFERVE